LGSKKAAEMRPFLYLFMRLFAVILVAAFVALALLMVGLGVKVLVRKKGEFKRHCASRDPYTGESNGCVCGKRMDARCKSKEKYQPLDVNENMMEEMRCVPARGK